MHLLHNVTFSKRNQDRNSYLLKILQDSIHERTLQCQFQATQSGPAHRLVPGQLVNETAFISQTPHLRDFALRVNMKGGEPIIGYLDG